MGKWEVKGWGSSKGLRQTIECLFEHQFFIHDARALLGMRGHPWTTLILQGHSVLYSSIVLQEIRCDLKYVENPCVEGHDGTCPIVGAQNDCTPT